MIDFVVTFFAVFFYRCLLHLLPKISARRTHNESQLMGHHSVSHCLRGCDQLHHQQLVVDSGRPGGLLRHLDRNETAIAKLIGIA